MRAAEVAAKLFGGPDTSFLVINVARMPVSWASGGMFGEVMDVPFDSWLSDASRLERDEAAEIAAEAIESGITDPDVLVLFGDPVEMICAAAEEHDVDVVVVGSHDKGFLRRFVEPSVADHVVHATSRPVLVVSGSELPDRSVGR
jgi:nucleotide-binding universal stress UspA family protein